MSELMKVIMRPGIVPKFRKFWDVVQSNGGVLGSLWRIVTTDDLKDGYFVGRDEFGNEYYENKRWYVGRSRWVVYSKKVFFEYDASQLPPEWDMWIKCTTDIPPTEKPPVQYKWMAPHSENKSGTRDAYVPYSTSRPKIQSWKPPTISP